MEREINFKVYLKNSNTGEIFSVVFDYAQIFSGYAKTQCASYYESCVVIAKAESTGKKYKDKSLIYDGDIIEDADGSKYMIRWSQNNLQYYFDGITNTLSIPLWKVNTEELKNIGNVKIE